MRWRSLPVPNPGITQALTAQVTKDPLLSHLLASRGVKDYSGAKEFTHRPFPTCHNPCPVAPRFTTKNSSLN